MVCSSDPITGRNGATPRGDAKGSLELAMQYRSQAIALAQQGRFAESEACCREALRIRPDDVDTLNDLGTALWQQRQPLEAEEIYRQACRLQPNDYRTMNNLGMALYEQRRMDEAAECYRQAIRIRPDGYQAITNLAVVLADEGMFDDAMKWLERARELEPHSAYVLQNIGMNLGRQGQWREAIDYYQKALQREPDFAEVHRNLAYALLSIGDYERGWVEYEWRLRCQPHPGFQINRTFWSGDILADRTILLHAEQGYGDNLQFLRYAPRGQAPGRPRIGARSAHAAAARRPLQWCRHGFHGRHLYAGMPRPCPAHEFTGYLRDDARDSPGRCALSDGRSSSR